MESRGRAVVVLSLLALCLNFCTSNDGPYIADEVYTYRPTFPNGSVCMTFSLEASIYVSYKYVNYSNSSHPVSIKEEEFELPNNTETTVGSYCSSNYPNRLLSLSWDVHGSLFNITFNFTIKSNEWYLAQVLFDFELDETNFVSPEDQGHQSYQTADGTKLFNRTFHKNQYFHCKSCKKLWLLSRQNSSVDNGTESGPCVDHDNKTVCSFMQLSHSVLYIGDLDKTDDVKKKLCVEDFIELQEIIIPSVVGGVLGVLLLVIFSAYLIAFLRRKSKEGRYETLNDSGY